MNASAEFGYDCPCDTDNGFILDPSAKKSQAASAGYGENDRCIVDFSTTTTEKPKPSEATTTKATTTKATTTTKVSLLFFLANNNLAF